MAKIKGPLMSKEASGSIGENLTFSKRLSGQQARFQRRQDLSNPSAAQIIQQTLYSYAVVYWAILSSAEKAVYDNIVEEQNLKMSGWNYFFELFVAGTLSTSLIMHLTLDEMSGNFIDLSGRVNNGVQTGGVTYGLPGKINKAVSFDGINDYIVTGVNNLPGGNSQRTYSFWFNTRSFAIDTSKVIISQDPAIDANGKQIKVCAEDYAVSISFTGHRLITPRNKLLINTWYHVAIVVPVGATTTAHILAYINGVAQTLSTELGFVQILNTGVNYLTLAGERYNGGIVAYHFPGMLDDVRIFNRALSIAEIKMLYNFGANKIN